MEQFCLFVGKQVSSPKLPQTLIQLKNHHRTSQKHPLYLAVKNRLILLYWLPWAVPVLSCTIALEEKLKVWNIVFVWSSAMSPWRAQPWENLYEECSRQCSYACSQEGSSLPLLLLHSASWAACCVGVSSHPVDKGSFLTHIGLGKRCGGEFYNVGSKEEQQVWKPILTWPWLDAAVTEFSQLI